jgi:hypothetical protein
MPGSRRGYNEAFARFFESPTRERLRDLLRDNRGEANELDFKRTWPRASKLAKHVLGFANFGGGCIVAGVEDDNETGLTASGLGPPTDKTELLDGLNTYLPDILSRQIEIENFVYEESEYPALRGKSFQVLFISDDPEHLPFVSTSGGEDLLPNVIYTRRAASTEQANYEELQDIVNRRLETGYSSRRELDLKTHLEQLQVLYGSVSPSTRQLKPGWRKMMGESLDRAFMDKVPNTKYPEEDYDTFVARCIYRKKKRIEMELDIQSISPDS